MGVDGVLVRGPFIDSTMKSVTCSRSIPSVDGCQTVPGSVCICAYGTVFHLQILCVGDPRSIHNWSGCVFSGFVRLHRTTDA